MKNSKLHFFRLEPSRLLSKLITMDDSERGRWITQIAIDLSNGHSEDEFAKSLIEEAIKYSETKRSAVKKRWNKSIHVNSSELQNDTRVSVCNTNSSNIKDKNITSNEVLPMEEVSDKKFCFDTAKKLNIDASVIGRFVKREKVLADILTRMLAIPFDDAKGATAYLVSAMKKSANDEQFPVPTTKQPYC